MAPTGECRIPTAAGGAKKAIGGGAVGIRMRRRLDLLVALHGVLRSGAAFVLLDPEDPPARHERITADAGLGLVLDELPTTDAAPPATVVVERPAVQPDDLA